MIVTIKLDMVHRKGDLTSTCRWKTSSAMSKPELTYFVARGRAEPVRMCYSLKGVEWDEKQPDRKVMHTDKETYPYGQVPRLVDGDVTVLQSLAILRHVGRKLDLYGKSDADAARIDSLLDGLEDMRNKTRTLVYGTGLSPDGFRHDVKTVLKPPPLPQASTGGSVMAIFEKFTTELNGSYYCKSGISIADIALANMVDCHLPLFPSHMNAFPALLAHHKKTMAEKGE